MKIHHQLGLRRLSLISIAIASAVHQTSQAAEDPFQGIEEIVVNARYIDESARDLPFSVSVVDGEILERARLFNLEDALRTSVGVDVSSFGGFNDTNVRMRGVGSLFTINAEDSSVVMNIDNVPLSARSASLASMDIERVEVLKGPQGTLFGRNSEAGAINIVSRRPTPTTQGYLHANAGEQGQYVLEGALGGAISETLSGRIAVRGAGSDGVILSQSNREPALDPEDLGARVSFMWQPGQNTEVLLIAEQQDQEGRTGLEIPRPYAEPPLQNIAPGLQSGESEQARYSLEINHDFDNFAFSSVTSSTTNDTEFRGCQSADLAAVLYQFPAEVCQEVASVYDTINQDFRLTSLSDSDMRWVVGVNGSRIDRRYDNAIPLFGNDNDREFETESVAVYGEVSYPFADRWSITAGTRFTSEDKEYDGVFFFGPTQVGQDRRTLSDDYWTGRLALGFEANENTNLYGVIARGYKSGGFTDFTTQVADGEPLKPAKVESYEFGVKGSNSNGQFSYNGAVFFNAVEDDHLLGYDPNTFAAQGLNTDTESKGVEIQGNWLPNEYWAFTVGFSYTDAEIETAVLGASGGDVQAGNSVPDVAPWNGLARVNYTTPLRALSSTAELDVLLSYRFLDTRAANPQNQIDLASNRKMDLQVMLRNGNMEYSIWGDNLLDERNELYAYFYGPGIVTGAPTRDRTFGASVAYRF